MLVDSDPDAAASRAYYAAFYAVSAVFAARGKVFRRHSEVEAAVHRDLVNAGAWDRELGMLFSHLSSLRLTGDYGGEAHVATREAGEAADAAARLLEAAREAINSSR